MIFDKEAVKRNLESLRLPNGSFIAASTPDYSATWLRDTSYCSFAYWFLGEFQKLKEGMWTVLDFFRDKRHLSRIKIGIASPERIAGGTIHAKYNGTDFSEIADNDKWGHHQLDALGLFLHIVADLDFKNIKILRDERDAEIIELIIYYLRSAEYWHKPDFGMWEECNIRHSSSIGAVVGGLKYIRKQRLAMVPEQLVQYGESALDAMLPNESRDSCSRKHHNHDCDAGQLALIWPYHIVSQEMARRILARVTDGHHAGNGTYHKLLQRHGFNRYWGDDYYRSDDGQYRGISAEWPMFKFWISIIHSQFHETEKAIYWFKEGAKEITNDGKIPEAYKNGRPNDQTPLAWAHALALIAFAKLPQEAQKQLTE